MPNNIYVFEDKFRSYQKLINDSLAGIFMGEDSSCDITMEAALYSLMAGGKRIRPVMMFAVTDMLSGSLEDVLPFACAVEMIHTYSLIHDDLPCMDNDDTRRGIPTCHIKYSEPIALLAGDALLNRAYEIMLSACINGDSRKIKAAAFTADMAGVRGMIGGQTIDILSGGKKIPEELLKSLHQKKTGCLLAVPVIVPVYLFRQTEAEPILENTLTEYARHIGLSFQIKDDLLDATSTKEVLGKSTGKDAAESKSTFVTLFGLRKAQILLHKEMERAHESLVLLNKRGYDTRFLEDLSAYLLVREN